MKKLTGKEILAILEENYDASAVGYGEWVKTKQTVDIDEELCEKAQEAKDNFWNKIKDELPSNNREDHPLFKEYLAMPSRYGMQEQLILKQLGLGIVEEVKQRGGEGQGETWYSVKHFKDHDVYIRTDGFYSSYNGTDFDYGIGTVVTPQEKVITVYE